MSGYSTAVKKLNEQNEAAFVRTDYRCAAQGCPNAGGIGGRSGVNRSGTCFYHYSEPDPIKWPEVTRRILSDDRMRDPTYIVSSIGSDKRTHGPRGWALALQARERAGEKLTPAQRAMYRAALPRAENHA